MVLCKHLIGGSYFALTSGSTTVDDRFGDNHTVTGTMVWLYTTSAGVPGVPSVTIVVVTEKTPVTMSLHCVRPTALGYRPLCRSSRCAWVTSLDHEPQGV